MSNTKTITLTNYYYTKTYIDSHFLTFNHITNTVEDNNNNAISSKAVYDYIADIIGNIEEDMLS